MLTYQTPVLRKVSTVSAPLLAAYRLGFNRQDAIGMEIALHPGARIGILGAPGSGKTRLLRALARLDPVAIGKVTWADVDVTRKPRWLLGKLRTFVALVLQNPYTFMEPWATVEKTLNKLEAMAILAQILGLPPLSKQYNIQILSGAGRVRLALARALLHHPAVLLLDDVFGSVAPDVWDELLQSLDGALHPEQALLIASQFGAALMRTETVFVVWAGIAVEWGARETVFSNPYYPYTRWLLSRAPGYPIPGSYLKDMEEAFISPSLKSEIVETSPCHWVRMQKGGGVQKSL